LAALSGFHAGDPDRPRIGGGAARAEEDSGGGGGDAEECDLFRVRRPYWVGIAIYAGVEIEQRFGREVINAYEGVIVARGDEGEARAIGRPAEFAGLSLGVDELRGFGIFFQTY
jgi:hypothetical protein